MGEGEKNEEKKEEEKSRKKRKGKEHKTFITILISIVSLNCNILDVWFKQNVTESPSAYFSKLWKMSDSCP